ncbi:MAG TPA: 2-C-methyl-D-erythritol 4-phosphate cytidylyltransferase, partial [Dehalococcoidia bacterium]|nr:2-C-methyl-D-erythritol 4-phosphate cytidylyltransferase [Dehalococcoidia bacterium]
LVDNVVLVVSDSARDDGERIVAEFGYGKVVDVVVGGARRQDSVLQGMDRLSDCGIIMVHDGARPFVSGDMISRGLDAMRMASAATAGVPVTDTIKIVDADMVVKSTPDRTTLWAAQTPQVFKFQLLREAHRRVTHDSTDDAAMVEALGTEVKVFMGSYENMKVTTPEDVSLAEAIHAARTRPSGQSA